MLDTVWTVLNSFTSTWTVSAIQMKDLFKFILFLELREGCALPKIGNTMGLPLRFKCVWICQLPSRLFYRFHRFHIKQWTSSGWFRYIFNLIIKSYGHWPLWQANYFNTDFESITSIKICFVVSCSSLIALIVILLKFNQFNIIRSIGSIKKEGFKVDILGVIVIE